MIELFGEYWHGKQKKGHNKIREEENKKEYYKRYGFQCLIIWENELRDMDNVLKKVKRFIRKKAFSA